MNNTNEAGRSMVEMLGVLAIIGVLSIGGIAGYTMAMNKYNANEIVSAVMQGAIYCRTQWTADTAVPSDITDGVKGLDSITCVSPVKGTVSFAVSSTDEVAAQVVKSVKVYSSAGGAESAGSNNVAASAAAANATYFYMPVS